MGALSICSASNSLFHKATCFYKFWKLSSDTIAVQNNLIKALQAKAPILINEPTRMVFIKKFNKLLAGVKFLEFG